MIEATIAALGGFRPRRVVTNEELSRTVDTTPEWILSRVGIEERRIASDDETLVGMGAAASTAALDAAGLPADAVDTVVVATCTAETAIPQAASRVARDIGATRAGAFDVNAGCSGFAYGLAVARDLVRSGSAEVVLLTGTERMSDWVDWTDRSTCVLLADAAASALVVRSESPGIHAPAWGSRGEEASVLGIPSRAEFFGQKGREVYRWATSLGPEVARALEVAGVAPEDLRGFFPHQANERIIDLLAERLGLGDHVHVGKDIRWSGNTTSASIPLAMMRALEQGDVAPGDLALLFGFGAGLSYAGQVVSLPDAWAVVDG